MGFALPVEKRTATAGGTLEVLGDEGALELLRTE